MLNKYVTIFILGLVVFTGCTKSELDIDKEIIEESVERVSELEPEGDTKPLVVMTKEDTLKILVRADGAPGMYLGEDGEVHGFYVDLERMVMKRMGQKYEFVAYSDNGPVIQAMKTGTHHIALATPDVPDYRVLANISIPYEKLNYVTFVKSDNKTILGETKDQLIESFWLCSI